MSKYVGIQRIYRAILNLPRWRALVDHQGATHLWAFLAQKQKGITAGSVKVYGEPEDKEFFDKYMRVRDTDEPYFDPLDGNFRIGTHPHSNVSTARKGTFSGTWKAAQIESKNGKEYVKFANNYLDILRRKVLSKGGVTTRVPVFDLLAWLYRSHEFPEEISLDDLIKNFRADFHISKLEYETIFGTEPIDGVGETEGKFFADHKPPERLLLTVLEQKERFDLSDTLESFTTTRKVQPVKLDDIVTLARQGRRQLILQGPPGTGKTFVARQVAALLLGASVDIVEDTKKLSSYLRERQFSLLSEEGVVDEKRVARVKGVWDIVQFHPSYTYEDFVRGIKASTPEEGGSPSFHTENRIFGTLADLSTKVTVPIVLIIDEINRGDLSKVLGELIYAIEYRGESVRTPYTVDSTSSLTVGENFFIIPTMNTADRSIALIDYAIRRRFDFIELPPDREKLATFLARSDASAHEARVLELYDEISKLFEGNPDYAVGHTYFMGKDTEDIARRVVFQVLPLLAEYQKEGVLGEHVSVGLKDWPGETGLPFKHSQPFLLAAELKSWLDGGGKSES